MFSYCMFREGFSEQATFKLRPEQGASYSKNEGKEYFLKDLFMREREKKQALEGEGERTPSRLSAECGAQCWAQSHNTESKT